MVALNKTFEELLSSVVKEGASDLHISVGRHPMLRVDGNLIPLLKNEIITPEMAQDFVFSILSEEQQKRFLSEKEMDISYNFRDRARFRVNIFFQKGFIGRFDLISWSLSLSISLPIERKLQF